jgi:hypothetical protein
MVWVSLLIRLERDIIIFTIILWKGEFTRLKIVGSMLHTIIMNQRHPKEHSAEFFKIVFQVQDIFMVFQMGAIQYKPCYLDGFISIFPQIHGGKIYNVLDVYGHRFHNPFGIGFGIDGKVFDVVTDKNHGSFS